jgi:DNA repair protein RecN (Recombination protein N)
LERSFRRLSRGQESVEAAQALAHGLIGDDGVFSKLGMLQRLAQELEEVDPGSGSLRERLVTLTVEAQDLGQEFERLASDFEFEPEEAERVMARMNLWLELQRKMGGSVEAVLQKRAELADRLDQQGDIEGSLVRLDQQAAELEKRLREMARQLRERREKAGCDLATRASKAIGSLGFKRAVFQVRIAPEEKLTARGGSQCQFFFAPNAGQEPAPLHKIASSGEIARVMLALKTVLATIDRIPVLVFDEVDANVGGEIGRIVGERMAELGQKHQVFCVTHLPQVASLARHHLVVEKQQEKGVTEVSITPLQEDRASRVGELARMLGDRRGKSALAHAEELLGG